MRFVNLVSLFAKQKNSKFSLLLPAVTAYVMFINETHRSIFGVHSIIYSIFMFSVLFGDYNIELIKLRAIKIQEKTKTIKL